MKLIGYIVRTLACFLLLFATWNPLGYSYLDWVGQEGGHLSAKVAVGALLLALHIFFARVVWLALRLAGVLSVLAFGLSGYAVLRNLQVLDPQAPFLNAYFLLTMAALIFAVGICWAHFKRRYSGQSQVLAPPP